MAQLFLVRHGHAASAWGDHLDPGLDEAGRTQAVASADFLAERLVPGPLRSSPMRRAQETAAPLAAAWDTTVTIDPAFGEIPSPVDDLAARRDWLSWALASSWDQLDIGVTAWRGRLISAASAIAETTVVFTHFVAINALVAHATADDAVTCFLPANGSVTEFAVDAASGAITVVQLGCEATPEVG